MSLKHSPDAGFTLLEVIIAMTISTLVLVIIASGFQISARAYERAQAGLDEQHRTRILVARLTHHLASIDIDLTRALAEDNAIDLFVGGTADKMAFVSQVSLLPKHRNFPALALLQSMDDGEGEHGLGLQESLWISAPQKIAEEFEASATPQLLLAGLDSLSFAYLKQTDEADSWEQEWHPQEDDWAPRGIRIAFKRADSGPPFTVIMTLPVVPAKTD